MRAVNTMKKTQLTINLMLQTNNAHLSNTCIKS